VAPVRQEARGELTPVRWRREGTYDALLLVDDEIKASAPGRLHGLWRESLTTEASVATAKQAHKKRYEYAPPDYEPANRKERRVLAALRRNEKA
jgi:hypothetical protein